MNDKEKIKLLSSDGMLIKRPLLITKEKIYVGFKEKEWEELRYIIKFRIEHKERNEKNDKYDGQTN